MSRNRTAWGLLIPRPYSFLANSLIFAAGMLFAWLEGFGGQETNGRLMLPSWLFVLLWFLVQELLVQQAKYMWNDIRDHERDQTIPANWHRPLARQPLYRSTTIVMAVRWITGVLLTAILSPVLLTVVLVITGLQIIYELWAKPHGAKRPLLSLFVVAAGMILKGGGGLLAMGWPAGDQRAWLYGLALFATGVVFASSFWRAEAAYFAGLKLPLPRGQNPYFAYRGMVWLKAGTAVTIVACTLLILDSYTHFLLNTRMHVAQVLALLFAAGVVCCRFCYWLVLGRREIRLTAVALFLIGCVATFWFRVQSLLPISNETFAAALLLLVLLIDHRLNYIMDYRQQNLIYLSQNWPSLKRIARIRPYYPGALIHWWRLLQLFLALNTPRYQLLWQRKNKDWPARRYLKPADSPARKREAHGGGRTN